MNIITDSNIISYCCTALLLVGFALGTRILTAGRKHSGAGSNYQHLGATSKNFAEMYNGENE